MRLKTVMNSVLNSSEIGCLLKQAREVYNTQRTNSNVAKSLFKAAKFSENELGAINSIFATIGVLAGTLMLPVPGGAIIGAEALLQLSKYSSKYGIKYAKVLGKTLNRII